VPGTFPLSPPVDFVSSIFKYFEQSAGKSLLGHTHQLQIYTCLAIARNVTAITGGAAGKSSAAFH
jgi:hypothetical protein